MTSNQDFDDFLTNINASDEVARKNEFEQTASRLHGDYDRALEQYNPLPRYTDRDPEIQAMLQLEAADYIRQQIIEELHTAELEISADVEKVIESEVMHIVEMAIIQEASVRSKILMMLAVHEYSVVRVDNPDLVKFVDAKKQLIADMMILDEYNADSSWVAFTNGVIPGPKFDPDYEDDQPYLIASLQKLANKNIEIDPMRLLLDQLAGLIYAAYPDNVKGHAAQDAAFSLAALVMSSAIMRSNKGEREAEITQHCRQQNIEQPVISQIMSLLEAQYPTK